ncbi:MAG: glycosyl hydrolase [Bacteroidota bacterium]
MKLRIALAVCFVFFAESSFGQFKNIKLDEEEDGSRPPCEPSIAINLRDRDNIVAAAILDKIYVTEDGGKTWSKQRVKSSYGVWGDPVLVSDTKGKFYFFHLSDPAGTNWQSEEILDRIVCQKSKDGGKTWDDGSFMGFAHPKDQDKEWAVVDLLTDNIYASWTQFDKYNSSDPNDKSNILFSQSTNGGKKWSKSIQINQFSGDCVDDDMTTEGAVPAIGPAGELFVAWAYNSKIYFDRSYDKGKTWLKTDMVVADQVGGWAMDIPGLNRSNGMPVLVSDQSPTPRRGTLYMVWADQRNGEDNTDIWFISSVNGGDLWTQPKKIGEDPNGKHQFLPWITVDPITGYIYIVYYDRSNYDDMRTDVYLSYSTDNGYNFKNVKISESPFIPQEGKFFGDYNNIAAFNGRICPIWTRMDDGKTSVWTAVIEHKDLEKK